MQDTITASNKPLNEQWSALLDGALSEQQTRQLLHTYAQDAHAQEQVASYLLIGDVLRDSLPASSLQDSELFWTKLQGQLLAAQAMESIQAAPVPAEARFKHWASRPAANQTWRWLGGVAASVLVVSVGWYVWGTQTVGRGVGGQELASAAGNGEQAVMLRDPELDALLEAHQEVGGHSALQMPAGFIRNATLEWSSP
ncbi:sigma-E factor negative regulatory protein [Curvibacter sp. CHRR-16]|uniref:sigma-E factor negative regulatory protein n=1 Tax=Curvibacter sp. CHRR-16 TaxID=2835872 RepID=UPI001BDA1282|nr:sigma-E factor negative regulatory protein [Curvibacter sp. CHRR-16]MBT0571360.1 sigma-E factor negative regulatory protein [Curvibacter sp. CHRR-16]